MTLHFEPPWRAEYLASGLPQRIKHAVGTGHMNQVKALLEEFGALWNGRPSGMALRPERFATFHARLDAIYEGAA